ncbi:MAG: DUF5990 family protein [Burkholderiaceae bacterium]
MSISAPSFVQLIVRVQDPPPEVAFAVQRGRSELLEPFAVESGSPCFALTLKLGRPLADGGANFLGEFAQGTPMDRFVYINSGVRAGQPASCWERRAKLKLADIPEPLLTAAAGQPDRAILATVQGVASDGGPICATVPPNAVTWALSAPLAQDRCAIPPKRRSP